MLFKRIRTTLRIRQYLLLYWLCSGLLIKCWYYLVSNLIKELVLGGIMRRDSQSVIDR